MVLSGLLIQRKSFHNWMWLPVALSGDPLTEFVFTTLLKEVCERNCIDVESDANTLYNEALVR